MIELQIGDIILVRGRSLRHTIARVFFRAEWNHALIYFWDGETQELNWKGTSRKSFKDTYANKQIVVLRLQNIDALVSFKRYQGFMDAMNELQHIRFSWVNYLLEVLGLPRVNYIDKCVCDEYINRVYRKAHEQFDGYDFKHKVNCIKLMKKDCSTRDLMKHNLIKVWDHRWN